MNKKITIQFTFFTLLMTFAVWGILVIGGRFGVTLGKYPWLYVLYLLGGLAPTVVSYLVLKKNNEVKGLKEWLKVVFNVKSHPANYILCVFLVALLFVLRSAISGLTETRPFYLFFLTLPLMAVGGGMEETGWRYILQPELEKKFGFILSALITTPIWAVWHLPLFFIPGVTQYEWNFDLTFMIGIMSLTFAIGAIRKISGNVFLCVLAHSMFNAASGIFFTEQSFTEVLLTNGILIFISLAAIFISDIWRRSVIRR